MRGSLSRRLRHPLTCLLLGLLTIAALLRFPLAPSLPWDLSIQRNRGRRGEWGGAGEGWAGEPACLLPALNPHHATIQSYRTDFWAEQMSHCPASEPRGMAWQARLPPPSFLLPPPSPSTPIKSRREHLARMRRDTCISTPPPASLATFTACTCPRPRSKGPSIWKGNPLLSKPKKEYGLVSNATSMIECDSSSRLFAGAIHAVRRPLSRRQELLKDSLPRRIRSLWPQILQKVRGKLAFPSISLLPLLEGMIWTQKVPAGRLSIDFVNLESVSYNQFRREAPRATAFMEDHGFVFIPGFTKVVPLPPAALHRHQPRDGELRWGTTRW